MRKTGKPQWHAGPNRRFRISNCRISRFAITFPVGFPNFYVPSTGATLAYRLINTIRCPATVALRVAARERRACFEAWYHIQDELTKHETQADSESLTAQSALSKFGKLSRSQKLSSTIGLLYKCVAPRSANQVQAQLEERGLFENLGEAVGHLVARADKVRFESAVELALAYIVLPALEVLSVF
eukprot:6063484-Pleurochrysis_carterae.AAC.1